MNSFSNNRLSFLTSFCMAFLAVFLLAATALGQPALEVKPAPTAAAADDGTSERIKQLEDQVNALREQIELLKKSIGESRSASSTSATPPAKTETAAATSAEAKPETRQQQQKQLGVDVGSARVVPYGTIYFNAFNNSQAVNNQDVPLFATPTGQGGASASARQTRLGLRLEGAKVGNARLSGVIEADFFGGFPNIGIGENFGVVRIRLANARLDWEKTSVTIGQDWIPFAPVNPTSIASAGIPSLAAAGNNFARIPQVRVDHKLTSSVTLTGAVLAPQTGDSPTASNFFLQPNTGAASRLPFFQSRIAYAGKNWLGSGKAGSVGFSGSYGRSRVTTPSINDIDSVGLALDWNLPLHKRVTLAGEAFFGRNLAGFQAGVFQGINSNFSYQPGVLSSTTSSRGIATKGGWTQVGFTPELFGDRWSIYGSIGLDDPRDSDLASAARLNFRSRNLAYAANTIFKVTPQFWLGGEFRRFETGYLITGKRFSEHVNLGATYSF